jgi:hypothetical protein
MSGCTSLGYDPNSRPSIPLRTADKRWRSSSNGAIPPRIRASPANMQRTATRPATTPWAWMIATDRIAVTLTVRMIVMMAKRPRLQIAAPISTRPRSD